MLKHGLISTEKHWAELVSFDLDDIDYLRLQEMVAQSVAIKENIVAQDPYEQGIRKALNLGHTAGHALESLALAEERLRSSLGIGMRTLPELPERGFP